MTTQDYIQTKLDELKVPLGLHKPDEAELPEAIYRLVMSKKFRKYSVDPTQAEHIKSVVNLCIKENKPIQLTLVFGGYKLWRLEETPEVDWAELFAFMYYSNWMKPICEIYKPGVWFDFFSDDVVVPQMNNVPIEDTISYGESFKNLLKFIKPYQPKNLNMTYNRVGDQYENIDAFQKDLTEQIKEVASNLDGGVPKLSVSAIATLDLNVKVSPVQMKDPKWHEKIQLIHDGYAQVKGRRPYYRTPDKMNVMTTQFPGMLSVGTTKDSVMKFWIGVGVLKPKDDSFRQLVLSPNQLKKSKFKIERVNIGGLSRKNFLSIRLLQ